MLDDLKMIHERDAQDALGIAEKQWQQLQYEYRVPSTEYRDIQNVVLAGMGGSAWPAKYLQSWPETTLPLEVVSNYELPAYVNQHTLFISYNNIWCIKI